MIISWGTCERSGCLDVPSEGHSAVFRMSVVFSVFHNSLRHRDVSENRGFSPQIIHGLIGCSSINHSFWGTTIFGVHTHIHQHIHLYHYMCQGPKGMVRNGHPTFNRENPYIGYTKTYYWDLVG